MWLPLDSWSGNDFRNLLHSGADRILLYMTHVMEKQKSKQFILCPYHEKNHWVLLVLCMAKREVINFDSLRQKRNLAIKFAMTNVLNNWVDVSVATTSCVICTKYLNITIAVRILFRIFQELPYTEEEINEIRDIWAEYFICNVELYT
ncbi:uncharacterized protein LOC110714824 isoform X2 [Chenopodium quinoa]|uniref:uncharacterized protein LOC110714824 isoform X2 n=1 Tax=Chenopodium quinoa TaxID=63459 RepID=UPI000B79AF09|nr:uncharacterized protein LOC110714824 isoform X2 [Chenopodium quinoa]